MTVCAAAAAHDQAIDPFGHAAGAAKFIVLIRYAAASCLPMAQAVRQVLSSLVASAPPDWRLVVDDATPTPGNGGGAVAVVFHLEDASGQAVPLSRGVAFYRLDQVGRRGLEQFGSGGLESGGCMTGTDGSRPSGIQNAGRQQRHLPCCVVRALLLQAGRIVHITEAAEQMVKMPQAVLPVAGAAAPLLQALRSSPLGSLVPGGLAAGMPIAAAAAATSQQPQQAFYAAAPAQPQASSSFGSSPTGMAATGRTGGASSSSSSPKARSSSIPAAVPPAASGSSGGSGGGAGGSDPGKIAGLAGVWIKDQAASDAVSYGRACDLLQASKACGGSWDWMTGRLALHHMSCFVLRCRLLLTFYHLPPCPAAERAAENDGHAAD